MNRFSLIGCLLIFSVFASSAQWEESSWIPQLRKDSIFIIRDQWGVPHIYAPTDEETVYGFMWATCEDDFKTLQETLLLSKGMNGRLKGADGAITDYIVQLLDIPNTVKQKYNETFTDKFKRILQASVDAVNEYARLHPDEIIVKKAFPVTVYDIIQGYVLGTTFLASISESLTRIFENRLPPLDPGKQFGSNGIAVHASKTNDGQNYIAINSHQPLEGPFSWYEAHLVSGEGMNMLGSSLIGAITLNQGVNENLAWAHTLNFNDFFDIYQLTMHPRKKNWYRFDGEWKKLEKKKIKLTVKLKKWLPVITVSKPAFYSVYGPTLKTKTGVYSIRGVAFNKVGVAEQWYRMSKSRNFTEFKKALQMQQMPNMNIVYADRFDTIFYISNGLYPKSRSPRYDWKKMLPGDTSETLWNMEEFYSIDELPQYLNPECGYVYNTNHTPFFASKEDCSLDPKTYCRTMGFQVRHFNRSKRLVQLMDTVRQFNWNLFKRIKYDMVLPDTVIFITSVEKFLEIDTLMYPDLSESVRILHQCERNGDTANPNVALWLIAFMNLMEETKFDIEFVPHSVVTPIEVYVKCLRRARDHIKKHFGSLQVPLGKVQRLRRADKDLPLPGLPDVLAAMYCKKRLDGTLGPESGECYILLAKIGKNGIELESVNAFGASNRPDNKHYTDQMEMFVNQKTKSMTLDKETIWKNAERIYHPK